MQYAGRVFAQSDRPGNAGLLILMKYVLTRDYQGKRVNLPYRSSEAIPLNLVLDIVPSSSADVTRALRGQQKRLSRNYRRRNGGNVIVCGLMTEMLSALSAVFLFGRAFVCFCTPLGIHYLAVHSV